MPPRLARWLALVGLSLIAFPLVPALVLTVWAETLPGRAMGIVVVLIAGALFALLRSPRVAGVLAAVATAGLVVLFAFAPAPRSGPRFSSIFLAGQHDPWAFAAMVPEIDQINVGLRLIAFIDRFIDTREATAIREQVLPLYRELDAEPEVEALGSELGQAYGALWGRPFDVGHAWIARPPVRRESSPGLIVLHGSAGNFKSYLWALRELSQAHGFVVAHPSFGFGQWDRAGGVEAVERIRRHLIDVERVDPARIYLVGISNGGKGVSLAGSRYPDHYRALGFISPVFADQVLWTDEFRERWRGRPLLVLTGGSDDRVMPAYVDEVAEGLRARGARVSYRVYEGEGHFLLFSARQRALGELLGWLQAE